MKRFNIVFSLVELAMQCNIVLETFDSSLHFLEKNVLPFERPRMPSVEELKEPVDVQSDSKAQNVNENVSLNEYLHSTLPCFVKLDIAKKEHYDDIQSKAKNLETNSIVEDFTFTETTPNGRLAIPMDSDTESGGENSDFITNDNKGTIMLGNKFCDKYNLRLSLTERESIYKTDPTENVQFKKAKVQLRRNSKGQFIKGVNATPIQIIKSHHDRLAAKENIINCQTSTQTSTISEAHIDVENIAGKEIFENDDINISDIDFDDTYVKNGFLDLDEYLNTSDISFLHEFNDTLVPEENGKSGTTTEGHRFFRPYKDYWMYHCIFSRVKSSNFAVFERALPRTFRWLLNECALIVEMSAEDLYEEVCLIEAYHSQTLTPSSSPSRDNRDNINPISKNRLNFIVNKW